MAIVNPQLLAGWDINGTNSVAPDSILINNGYPFEGIPASSEHNYIFRNILLNLNFIKENGVFRWDSGITYPKQAMVARDEIIYFSLIDGNVGNDPITDAASWIDWVSLADASYKTTGVTNAASASTILATPYFGTAASPADGKKYSIKITAGEITYPSNMKVTIGASTYNIDGTFGYSGADSTNKIVEIVYNGSSFDLTIGYNSALKSISGLTTSADKMIYTTASNTYATTTLTSFARTLLDDTTASAARATLGLTIGTNVQAYDAGLQSISGLTTAADRMIYATGPDTYAVTTLTPFARTILDDTTQSQVLSTLGTGKIDVGSSLHSDGIIKHKIIDITISDGYFFNSAAHGISSAFDSHRIIDVSATITIVTSIFGGGYSGDSNDNFLIKSWSYTNTDLTIVRNSSPGTYTFKVFITYV